MCVFDSVSFRAAESWDEDLEPLNSNYYRRSLDNKGYIFRAPTRTCELQTTHCRHMLKSHDHTQAAVILVLTQKQNGISLFIYIPLHRSDHRYTCTRTHSRAHLLYIKHVPNCCRNNNLRAWMRRMSVTDWCVKLDCSVTNAHMQ